MYTVHVPDPFNDHNAERRVVRLGGEAIKQIYVYPEGNKMITFSLYIANEKDRFRNKALSAVTL